MQEGEGIIEKGAPLWDYGVTSESGVNLPFRVSAESGWMPPYPALDLSRVKVYDTYEEADEASKQLMNLPIPMAADGLPGIRLNDEPFENLNRINMGLSPIPKPSDYDKVPVLLEPGTSCYPKNWLKILQRESRRSKLQLESDRNCDFVGRAADL